MKTFLISHFVIFNWYRNNMKSLNAFHVFDHLTIMIHKALLKDLNIEIILTKDLNRNSELQKKKSDHNWDMKGSIYVASISLVQWPTNDIWFSRWFINSKIYRCLSFLWVNWLAWSKILFVIFQIDISNRITSCGHPILRISLNFWRKLLKMLD